MDYKKIFISCGELSGEIHASNLIKEIHRINKQVKFFTVGGSLLKKQNCKIIIDYKEISIIGFLEVIKKYFYIKKKINIVKKFIKAEMPDIIILIDFPGFNFIIAEYAKRFNIKIVYYIPPQIWAWHYSRVKKIKKFADLVIPILPFESELYKKEEVPYKYFGHPVIDNICISNICVKLSKKDFYRKYHIPFNKKIIALLPGSRNQEICLHIPFLLGTAQILEKKHENLFFIINVADTVSDKLINHYIKEYNIKNILVIKKENYNLFHSAFAGLCVSGTVTLEAAYFTLPIVVLYKVDQLFYLIVKYLLIKVPYISLINLIASKEIVKEIVQKDLTVNNLVLEMDNILLNKNYRDKMILALKKVKNSLGKKGVVKKIAGEINQLLYN